MPRLLFSSYHPTRLGAAVGAPELVRAGKSVGKKYWEKTERGNGRGNLPTAAWGSHFGHTCGHSPCTRPAAPPHPCCHRRRDCAAHQALPCLWLLRALAPPTEAGVSDLRSDPALLTSPPPASRHMSHSVAASSACFTSLASRVLN